MKDRSINQLAGRSPKPETCPECGSKRIADIIYGLPAFTPEQIEQWRRGEIRFGGCVIGPGFSDAKWECADCGYRPGGRPFEGLFQDKQS